MNADNLFLLTVLLGGFCLALCLGGIVFNSVRRIKEKRAARKTIQQVLQRHDLLKYHD